MHDVIADRLSHHGKAEWSSVRGAYWVAYWVAKKWIKKRGR